MTIEEVKVELARGQAEAVRMLDAWVAQGDLRSWSVHVVLYPGGPEWRCVLRYTMGSPRYTATGDSPEAARANAAEAIRSEL